MTRKDDGVGMSRIRKCLILSLIFLSSCTLRVENRTDDQIKKDEIKTDNVSLRNHCLEKCTPFKLIGFIPVDYRCICGDEL